MEDFLGLFATPLQSILSILLLSLLYVGVYLVFVALLPNEIVMIEQLFVLLFIVSFGKQVIDAFVVLYELISVLQSFFVAVIPILSMMLLTMQSVFTLLTQSDCHFYHSIFIICLNQAADSFTDHSAITRYIH